MNILIVQETDWLVRGPHQQHHLAEKLALEGHKIRVIDYEILWRSQGKRALYSKRRVFYNVSKIYQGAKITLIRPGIIRIPWLDYISLTFAHRKEINRQIREFSPDVIIGLGILNSYLAVKAARYNVIPFVYYWIDVLHRLVPFKVLQPIAKMLEAKTLRLSDRVLVINEKLRDCVIELGAPPKYTHVLKAGIDIEQFSRIDNGNAIRKQYGLKQADIVLFFMGWLYNFSGLEEVAVKLAEARNDRFKLLIVGEGDAYEKLKQIQNKYTLQDRVILTGKKPYHEIPAFIAASDICLLPAYPTEKIMQDIVPIKMYEYMVMAKPVISTRLPGIMKEFGEDNGVVYVKKPEDVVKKAVELVDEGKLQELGVRGRDFVKRYSWDNIANEFKQVLQEVVHEKRKNQNITAR